MRLTHASCKIAIFFPSRVTVILGQKRLIGSILLTSVLETQSLVSSSAANQYKTPVIVR